MELKNINIIKSPTNSRKMRLAGEVHYDDKPNTKTAAFFSGGIDSFFTVLRHNTGTGSSM